MTLLKVDFVGLRVNRMEETVALFRDVLGVPVGRQMDGLVGFRLADGSVLEVYGAADKFHSFFTTGPVVAFRVENFDHAHQPMTKAGISFIGDVQCRDGVSGSISIRRMERCWKSSALRQTNVGHDRSQLSHMAEQAKSALNTETLDVVADRGYYDSEEILACDKSDIAL